jgi:GT2 family glycosyltransferase
MNFDQQLAILIPTRNRPGILQRTLDELKLRGFNGHPLLVYDDASEDSKAVATVVASWLGSRLIRSPTRTGQAKGRNRLMRETTAEFALFLDDDSWPEDRTVLLRELEVISRDGLAVATFQYRSLADGKLSASPKQGRCRVSTFLGGASVLHVPSVLAVGGYREVLVYGYEEPELAVRLWLAGMKMEYLPGVVVAHNHFETPNEKRDHREYDYFYARNSLLMSSLNMPFWFGLPHGLARSLRFSLYNRRNLGTKAKATLAGIGLSFSLWRQRTPCSARQAFEWCRPHKTSSK